MTWHLRVHLESREEAFNVYQYLISIVDVILCVFEQHDNRPHIHMLFDETKLSKSRVIQKLLEKFPGIKGNASYSCQDVTKAKKKKGVDEPEGGDIEKAKAYLCKGVSVSETPIVIGETNVDVDFYHIQYWNRFLELKAKNKEVNMGCQNDSSLVVKAKSKSWTEKVYDEINVKFKKEIGVIVNYQLIYRPSDSEHEMYYEARRDIFRHMMLCLGKSVKKLSSRIIEEIWQGFMNAIIQNSDNVEAKNAYSDKLFNSIVGK